MGFVHTTGTAPELLYPGLAKLWGTSYKDYPKIYPKFCTVRTEDKRAFVKDQEINELGLASVKDQGDSVAFDRITQGFQKEYVFTTYGIGAKITREMMEDDLYNVINRIPQFLAKAMVRTEETLATNVLNNAFDSTVTGADGEPLCDSAHPNSGSAGGTQNNTPTTAADLTQASLEAAWIDVSNFRDGNGNRIVVTPKKLIVSRSDFFNATKILETKYKTASADNDVNVLSNLGLELVVTNYLTDQDAWFLINDVEDGIVFYRRREASINRDNDVNTENLSIVTTGRFDVGFTNWRGVYGSPGA